MIYRLKPPNSLWDSCLFEWDGTFHLYHLESSEKLWDRLGHAVSADLVHWEARDPIHIAGRPGDWNEGPMILTGMVVPHDGRFYLFAGGRTGGRQVMGVFTSGDLDHWEVHPASPVLCPEGPHYLSKPTPHCPEVDWRDPCIHYRKDDGHYHALLCARLPEMSHRHSGATIAHVRSRDLIRWEHLPPIQAPTGRFYDTEVPDVFEMDGRYYLLFSTASSGAFQINTAGRENATGTFYMVGDDVDGPFSLPDEYLLIGAGQGKMAAYCGRTIAHEDGRLFYHHINHGGDIRAVPQKQADRELRHHVNYGGDIRSCRHAWGSPKRVRTSDGKLYLEYMPILERLETGILCGSVAELPVFDAPDLGRWERAGGRISARSDVRMSSCRICRDAGDLHLACEVRASSDSRPGFLLRSAAGEAALVTLNFARQRLEIGTCTNDRSGWGLGMDDVLTGVGVSCLYSDLCAAELKDHVPYRVRCFARDEHFEVYLDGRWVFTTVLPHAARRGDIELCVAGGAAEFSDLRIAAIEPFA